MISESTAAGKASTAHCTCVGLYRRVDREVVTEIVLVRKGLSADVARKGLVFNVGLPVRMRG